MLPGSDCAPSFVDEKVLAERKKTATSMAKVMRVAEAEFEAADHERWAAAAEASRTGTTLVTVGEILGVTPRTASNKIRERREADGSAGQPGGADLPDSEAMKARRAEATLAELRETAAELTEISEQRMQTAREAHENDMTIADIAEAMGVTSTRVTKWLRVLRERSETGRRRPSKKIADLELETRRDRILEKLLEADVQLQAASERRALALLKARELGVTYANISAALGVHESTVHRWLHSAREQVGAEGDVAAASDENTGLAAAEESQPA
jgi:transposase-like protein